MMRTSDDVYRHCRRYSVRFSRSTTSRTYLHSTWFSSTLRWITSPASTGCFACRRGTACASVSAAAASRVSYAWQRSRPTAEYSRSCWHAATTKRRSAKISRSHEIAYLANVLQLFSNTRCVAMLSVMAARSVGQNPFGPIFRHLWTKVYRIKLDCAGVSVVCNAVFRLTMFCCASEIFASQKRAALLYCPECCLTNCSAELCSVDVA